MKRLSFLFLLALMSLVSVGQQTGYYNGTSGKQGEELKAALNNIIKDHVPYSYYVSKEIFKLSDADPNNPNNVILVYTGRSQDNNDYGTGGNFINREHVWAKSHGDFTDWLPMYSDVHNLKPADASVNVDKSNKDFDNGGVQHNEATGCYFTDSTWEARDEVKGDIARIIFYMATRYEGQNGEIDLEVVDRNNTFPNAQHGKLSTLLQWNEQDPPDAFERNRNNVIFAYQKNRNPFIDNPHFANMIWAGASANPLTIDDVAISPQVVVANEEIEISATIKSTTKGTIVAVLKYGTSFENLTNEIVMTGSGDEFTAVIPGQGEDATIYYNIVANNGIDQSNTVTYNFYVPKVFTGTLVSIYDIQGQQEVSPYSGQTVSTSGVVTANFGTSYFIQDGTGAWNGMFIYESGRNPSIGDSIILTGKVSEYYGKTEISNITDYYFISSNNTLPEPVVVATGEVSEEHESILIKVMNATCIDENYQADYFMWKVDDGSGMLKVHNTSVFEYEPVEGVSYDITGPLNFDFDEWKIELRYENDVREGTDINSPVVVSVEPVLSTNLQIIFSEDVEKTSAENLDNYAITSDITIQSAVLHAFDKTRVNLTITQVTSGITYDLTISNVQDLSGNVMESQTESFTWVGLEEIFETGTLVIYPNPADENINLTFSLKQAASVEVSLSDISGRQLLVNNYQATSGRNQLSINVGNLAKGLYLMHVNTDLGGINYKIVIK